ncbi:MAG: UDP-N-acetylmuramate dehydrogenase [Candidatus Taylorbacteria bacterium]|nr:UDP-N-acetylmuramate dehydrogenase [Candidatus Taylorbacteria bacterium]
MQVKTMKILKNIKLAKYTTFHIGGKAEYFADVKSIEELKKAVDFAKNNKLKIFVLGGGSNILLPDKGLKGLVLKMNIRVISFQDNILSAGAGNSWDNVVAQAVKKGLGGIENLSLIPGTVGGAVYQNIGAYGAELKDVLDSVEVFDTNDDLIKTLSNRNCRFGYRDSVFQHPEGNNYLILGVILKLKKGSIPNITYPDLIKYFENKTATTQEVRKAVVRIRKAKLDYPTISIGTVGSFFKNPVVTTSNFQLLTSNYLDIRGRDIGDGLVKLFAGQLTEKAGWKGKRYVNVGVSKRHAMVLVSYKSAKSKDILNLARKIQKSVKTKFGIHLEPEVKIMA